MPYRVSDPELLGQLQDDIATETNPKPQPKKRPGFKWDSVLSALVPFYPSEAEAGQLNVYAQRNRALADAAYGNDEVQTQTDIPQARTAEAPRMSTAEANARLDRLIADQRQRELAASPKAKPFIPVRQVVVRTADGESLMYKDAKGRLYENDPNE